MVDESVKQLGGIDVVISNAVCILIYHMLHSLDTTNKLPQGWTKFSDFSDLNALNEDEWDKVGHPLNHPRFKTVSNISQCWSANVKGPLALLQAALPTFNANPEGGVLLITSSIAVRPMKFFFLLLYSG